MTKFSYALILTALFCCVPCIAQKKTLFATRVAGPIKIDGKIDEDLWKTAEVATDFVMYSPDNGKPIDPAKKTDVKLLYDDDAIYIAALMFDDEPEKILKEIRRRDDFGTAEHFGIFVNGYNDGQQDFRFFVSAAGVQMDCITTEQTGEDFSWDAIWESSVSVTDFGWVAEIKIPYAALRFPTGDKQSWSINFYRELRRFRQQYTWNFIDRNIGNEIAQAGNLQGVDNIKPPTRLFFIPYSSAYFNTNKDGGRSTFKAGLDVKYGISDAFTLDAILVPDFGQTRYDNVELNLGPFEQQFIENRPFFTEGTDLFNKGGLLYTRRIGGAPSTAVFTDDPDVRIYNPQTVDLINAVKISGRTKGGLGIGILNAITERTFATATFTPTGEEEEILVEPLTNFNVFVLDQRFNRNSSVSFINTSVIRSGEFRDANVSAVAFDISTANNKWNAAGEAKYSYINEYGDFDDYDGHNFSLRLADISGNYRYNAGGGYISENFDPNDLGINFLTDFHWFEARGRYLILNPTKNFNTFEINVSAYTEMDNDTGRLQASTLNGSVEYFTPKNDFFRYSVNTRPLITYDFYEPRFADRFLYIPPTYGGSFYFSSNYNRKFAIDINPAFSLTDEKNREAFSVFVEPRYRFNDRLTVSVTLNYIRQNNNVGYIDDSFVDSDTPFDIYMTKRNRTTYNVTNSIKYSINKDMTLSLNSRYYWSYAENKEFFTLSGDGDLIPATYDGDADSNFNTWNLDLSYSWWFAPGSQISVLYRNNADFFTRDIDKDFGRNLDRVFTDDLNHIFSVSIRYFIDYNRMKNWF